MLKIENVSTGYGKNQVLFNVSFEAFPGEVVLITGGNASGKSSLLKSIYNILPIWSGNIYFNGEELTKKKTFELIRKGIVYIPQKDFYFEDLTVEENLQTSGSIMSKKKLKERISEIYDLTDLSKYRKRKPFNLSGGERKLLAFSMALIHNPQLLLFDEPFAGVDNKSTNILISIFKKVLIQPNNTIIVVEHKDDSKQLYTRKIRMELGILKNYFI